MSRIATRPAHAKINLTLDVTGRRADGYHEVCMIMQTIALHDTVTVSVEPTRPATIALHCGVPGLPEDARNLAYRAAEAFLSATGIAAGAVTITIEKRIPMAAGLAGGSTDAAAVLHTLNELLHAGLSEEKLCEIGLPLGADVPYCIRGGTMLARGIGEQLSPLPAMPHCTLLLCKIPAAVSTREIYERVDREPTSCQPDTDGMITALREKNLAQIGALLENVMESVTAALHPEITAIREEMLAGGACGARMSGSGPTVFGLFLKAEDAETVYSSLHARYPDTFLSETV